MTVRVLVVVVLLCALTGAAASASPLPNGGESSAGSCDGDTGQFFMRTYGIPVKAITGTSTCTSAWVADVLTTSGSPTIAFYLPPGVSATISWDVLKLLPEAPLKRDGSAGGGGLGPCDPNYVGVPSYVIEGDDLLIPITC